MSVNLDNIQLPTKNENNFIAESKNKLQMSKETYFKILMTQMKYQDPSNPTRPEAIAEQMMNMAEIEQMISLNEQMSKIAQLQEETKLNSAVNFIGKSIIDDGVFKTIAWDEHTMLPNPVAFNFNADNPLAGAKMVIVDELDNIVYRNTDGYSVHPGENIYRWDGFDNAGKPVKPGSYRLKIHATKEFSSNGELKGDEGIDFKFSSLGEYKQARYQVKDNNGRVIHSGNIHIVPGENKLSWDGKIKSFKGDTISCTPGRYNLVVETNDLAGISTKFSKQVVGVIPEGRGGKIEVILDDNSTRTLKEIDNLFALDIFAAKAEEAALGMNN